MILQDFKQQRFWLQKGPNMETVLSCRVRLARNISGVSFAAQKDEGELALLRAGALAFSGGSAFRDGLSTVFLDDISSEEKRFLREKNLITGEMESTAGSILIVSLKENFSIMVNEEDHFRIQVIKGGLSVFDAYRLAERVDDELNRFCEYLFSERYGFITASPSNLGTGMKASVLFHLPAVSLRSRAGELFSMIRRAGADMSGGEKGLASSGFYQISNRASLGISEIDITEIIDSLARRVMDFEEEQREILLSSGQASLEDLIWRSCGLLRYSRKISARESLMNLSLVRFGIVLGFIKEIGLEEINNLMVNIQDSHLRSLVEPAAENADMDERRAAYIRSFMEIKI